MRPLSVCFVGLSLLSVGCEAPTHPHLLATQQTVHQVHLQDGKVTLSTQDVLQSMQPTPGLTPIGSGMMQKDDGTIVYVCTPAEQYCPDGLQPGCLMCQGWACCVHCYGGTSCTLKTNPRICVYPLDCQT